MNFATLVRELEGSHVIRVATNRFQKQQALKTPDFQKHTRIKGILRSYNSKIQNITSDISVKIVNEIKTVRKKTKVCCPQNLDFITNF